MTFYNLLGFLILLVLAFGLAAVIWAAVSKSLHGLLDHVVKLPDGTVFYMRIFLIGLLLAAASGSVDTVFDFKSDAHFMEYVWQIAAGLRDVFMNTLWYLVGYLALITVLAAVLRPRRE